MKKADIINEITRQAEALNKIAEAVKKAKEPDEIVDAFMDNDFSVIPVRLKNLDERLYTAIYLDNVEM